MTQASIIEEFAYMSVLLNDNDEQESEFCNDFLNFVLRDIFEVIHRRCEQFRQQYHYITGAGMGTESLFSSFRSGMASLGRETGTLQAYEEGVLKFHKTKLNIAQAEMSQSLDKKISFLDSQFNDWRKGLADYRRKYAASKVPPVPKK